MKSTIIKLDNVWKTYKMGDIEVHALQGLSLEVKAGEFLAIQGASGSGKSTAMNMIGCLDIPTKGRVYLESQDISRLSESNLAQIRGKKIGFIFQQFNLVNTLSAMENILLPMIFQNISREERENKAKELLNIVELGDRMDHKPTELSGGQQQRVAIARSLSNDPDVILADEPTGNLDSKTGENVMHFLQKMHKEKKTTIVMVTHDAHLAKFAQRIVQLKDGKLIRGRK
ncbi:MAG: ABC transporter ATP-binding protein [Candidatus Woesearchaeota archaeon]|jgi:putative ABC transport system ATP-binding protein|nr:lipoprotein-releasing system ATP-binding protein LolD [archaeon]MDP6547716.1 ABC transporter ATP-binding protein [Candidatus Woesearchaeota archaeon]MDP7263784.1 ABC transporter ATP-binding protein [Candidatus Woesearchaeota archaeon]MDP7622841.1 ABC transporter ATP-binding protein [Candidatus Woesearchaeota archaeon]HJN56899.1 ABC transporter ATP-binding protein [Candidatus Woesearchaeota archaeon]|tara:strand:+ start:40616 stop:41302 length:687 start_codon:yes stop_codon:yes gene_type:complete